MSLHERVQLKRTRLPESGGLIAHFRKSNKRKSNKGDAVSERSLLNDALVRLGDAAGHLGTDLDVIEMPKYFRETTVGAVDDPHGRRIEKVFLGLALPLRRHTWPDKGWHPFPPRLHRREGRDLGILDAFKCAVMNLPCGGGRRVPDGHHRYDTSCHG